MGGKHVIQLMGDSSDTRIERLERQVETLLAKIEAQAGEIAALRAAVGGCSWISVAVVTYLPALLAIFG